MLFRSVWVMEPLRGGRLVNVTPEEEGRLKAMRPGESVPAWAFRFLQTVSGVTVTLSGMSNFRQMKENIATFEEEKPLTDKEMEGLLALAEGMLSGKLPCTACRYCTAHCPKGLDIPMLLKLYNEHNFTGGGFIAPMVLSSLPEEKKPAACIGCKSCEAVCPQRIGIAGAMADFNAKLNG